MDVVIVLHPSLAWLARVNWPLILHGAATGAMGALSADYHAFQTWKSAHDAVTYNWRTAGWRFFQGVAIGAVGAANIGGGWVK